MNPFQKDVFIRLSTDGSAFTCRTQYGRIFSKTAEFVINSRTQPAAVEDPAFVLVKRDSGRHLRDGRTADSLSYQNRPEE